LESAKTTPAGFSVVAAAPLVVSGLATTQKITDYVVRTAPRVAAEPAEKRRLHRQDK
jgi:hypothetical protein